MMACLSSPWLVSDLQFCIAPMRWKIKTEFADLCAIPTVSSWVLSTLQVIKSWTAGLEFTLASSLAMHDYSWRLTLKVSRIWNCRTSQPSQEPEAGDIGKGRGCKYSRNRFTSTVKQNETNMLANFPTVLEASQKYSHAETRSHTWGLDTVSCLMVDTCQVHWSGHNPGTAGFWHLDIHMFWIRCAYWLVCVNADIYWAWCIVLQYDNHNNILCVYILKYMCYL